MGWGASQETEFLSSKAKAVVINGITLVSVLSLLEKPLDTHFGPYVQVCSPPSPSLQRALRLDSVACLSVPGNFLEREKKGDERKFSCFLLFWYKEVAHIKAVRIVQ